jgi:hypothetical protein
MVNIHVRFGALTLTYATAPKAPSPRSGQTLVCAVPSPSCGPRRSWRWLGFCAAGALAFLAGVGVGAPSAQAPSAPVTASLVAHR